MFEVLHPGLMTTVQDGGRPGYRSRGVPVCGAMDGDALRLCNLLLGNPAGTEALECTLAGPHLRFDAPARFVLCGADMPATLNGEPAHRNRVYAVSPGDELRLGAAVTGCRTTLGFAGGMQIPKVMGSRSTYLTGKFGGLQGRALRAGDRIDQRFSTPDCPLYTLPESLSLSSSGSIRVIAGAQQEHFAPEALPTLLSSTYTVQNDSDRMGCRLKGPSLPLLPHLRGNLLSRGAVRGGIQVPSDQPILLLADHQATGGYAFLAHVISADWPRLGQLRPGDCVRFCEVSYPQARDLLVEKERFFALLSENLHRGPAYCMRVQSAGQMFDAQIWNGV